MQDSARKTEKVDIKIVGATRNLRKRFKKFVADQEVDYVKGLELLLDLAERYPQHLKREFR